MAGEPSKRWEVIAGQVEELSQGACCNGQVIGKWWHVGWPAGQNRLLAGIRPKIPGAENDIIGDDITILHGAIIIVERDAVPHRVDDGVVDKDQLQTRVAGWDGPIVRKEGRLALGRFRRTRH